MSHLKESDFLSLETTRSYDKRIGYCDAVMDLIDLVTKMGLDNETVMNIQSKMVEKMGKYLRPTDANSYDNLDQFLSDSGK